MNKKQMTMSKIVKCEMATTWKRALNAARQTVGKKELNKEPTKKWWASVLLPEHSPIRLVEYDFKWEDIKMWVTTHLVRHHEGCEKFVHTQREDRRDIGCSRDELPQGSLNDMLMPCNAQALINISRKRLCGCASKETREAWQQVKDAIREIDPVLADKMVPECQYRGFCPEMDCCGYVNSKKYQEEREKYLKRDYEGQCGEDEKKNIKKEKNNILYEFHVYYIHDNESYVFKTAALNENDAKNKTIHALRAFEDLQIYDIVKV